jgi:hypothetical protein
LRARLSSKSEGGLRASDFAQLSASFIEGCGYVGQDGGQAGTDFLTDRLGLTYN